MSSGLSCLSSFRTGRGVGLVTPTPVPVNVVVDILLLSSKPGPREPEWSLRKLGVVWLGAVLLLGCDLALQGGEGGGGREGVSIPFEIYLLSASSYLGCSQMERWFYHWVASE